MSDKSGTFLLVGGVFGIILGSVFVGSCGQYNADAVRRDAVKHNAAVWVSNTDGSAVFKWKDELETERTKQ